MCVCLPTSFGFRSGACKCQPACLPLGFTCQQAVFCARFRTVLRENSRVVRVTQLLGYAPTSTTMDADPNEQALLRDDTLRMAESLTQHVESPNELLSAIEAALENKMTYTELEQQLVLQAARRSGVVLPSVVLHLVFPDLSIDSFSPRMKENMLVSLSRYLSISRSRLAVLSVKDGSLEVEVSVFDAAIDTREESEADAASASLSFGPSAALSDALGHQVSSASVATAPPGAASSTTASSAPYEALVARVHKQMAAVRDTERAARALSQLSGQESLVATLNQSINQQKEAITPTQAELDALGTGGAALPSSPPEFSPEEATSAPTAQSGQESVGSRPAKSLRCASPPPPPPREWGCCLAIVCAILLGGPHALMQRRWRSMSMPAADAGNVRGFATWLYRRPSMFKRRLSLSQGIAFAKMINHLAIDLLPWGVATSDDSSAINVGTAFAAIAWLALSLPVYIFTTWTPTTADLMRRSAAHVPLTPLLDGPEDKMAAKARSDADVESISTLASEYASREAPEPATASFVPLWRRLPLAARKYLRADGEQSHTGNLQMLGLLAWLPEGWNLRSCAARCADLAWAYNEIRKPIDKLSISALDKHLRAGEMDAALLALGVDEETIKKAPKSGVPGTAAAQPGTSGGTDAAQPGASGGSKKRAAAQKEPLKAQLLWSKMHALRQSLDPSEYEALVSAATEAAATMINERTGASDAPVKIPLNGVNNSAPTDEHMETTAVPMLDAALEDDEAEHIEVEGDMGEYWAYKCCMAYRARSADGRMVGIQGFAFDQGSYKLLSGHSRASLEVFATFPTVIILRVPSKRVPNLIVWKGLFVRPSATYGTSLGLEYMTVFLYELNEFKRALYCLPPRDGADGALEREVLSDAGCKRINSTHVTDYVTTWSTLRGAHAGNAAAKAAGNLVLVSPSEAGAPSPRPHTAPLRPHPPRPLHPHALCIHMPTP